MVGEIYTCDFMVNTVLVKLAKPVLIAKMSDFMSSMRWLTVLSPDVLSEYFSSTLSTADCMWACVVKLKQYLLSKSLSPSFSISLAKNTHTDTHTDTQTHTHTQSHSLYLSFLFPFCNLVW